MCLRCQGFSLDSLRLHLLHLGAEALYRLQGRGMLNKEIDCFEQLEH